MFQVARSSNLAVEALAGLASVEDFKSVSLRSSSLPLNQSWLPYRPTMLLHVKGRTHVQTRLVAPCFASINRGDCFVLLANQKLFRYVGQFANVIEKTRSKAICGALIENRDLGFTGTREYLINDGKTGTNDRHQREFWQILGRADGEPVAEAGHADEDDLFESCLVDTNMVYEYRDEQLVPVDQCWGALPRVDMLDARKVLVFNFGTEVYVWMGKSAVADDKRAALRLAHELFSAEFDYGQCELNPFSFSLVAGDRSAATLRSVLRTGAKPDWCVLAKVRGPKRMLFIYRILYIHQWRQSESWPPQTIN